MKSRRPTAARGTGGRRAFLRGLGGLAVGLPFLEAVAPKTARADAPKAPKRFIVMYTSNGTVLKNFRPTSLGSDFEMSPILTPLDTALLRPKLSVLSGIRMASAQSVHGNAHANGITSMLVGRPFAEVEPTEFGDVGWGSGISFDQFLAKRLADEGQLASIELGVQTQTYGNFYSYMSYGEGGGSTNAVVSDDDPRNVFQRLFANVPDGTAAAAELEKALNRRKSVLDFVQEDFSALKGKLGKDDQARLDKHADLIRDLETRLHVGSVCEKPEAPDFGDDDIMKNDQFPTIGRTQMDLLAAALACDVTRVGTLQWSCAQSSVSFNDFVEANYEGLHPSYHHGLSHLSTASNNDDPSAIEQQAMDALTKIGTFFSGELAHLASRLAEFEEEDGSTVLDNTTILWTSEIAEGPTHSFDDMPYVLLGDLGGALRPGHYDFHNDRSHNDLFITIAQAAGATDVTTFGGEEFVQGPLEELLS